jgi:hypothetical protein
MGEGTRSSKHPKAGRAGAVLELEMEMEMEMEMEYRYRTP